MPDTYLLLGEVLPVPATSERPAGLFMVVGRSHYPLPGGGRGTMYELVIPEEWHQKQFGSTSPDEEASETHG